MVVEDILITYNHGQNNHISQHRGQANGAAPRSRLYQARLIWIAMDDSSDLADIWTSRYSIAWKCGSVIVARKP